MGQSADTMSTRGMSASAVPFGGKAAKAPEYLKQSLVFPYFAGLHFVQRARRQGGWRRVDALYADLPASTEQILHPEKYWDAAKRDDPVDVPAGDAGAGARLGTAVALAGEISLGAAISSLDWVSSHEKYGRNR